MMFIYMNDVADFMSSAATLRILLYATVLTLILKLIMKKLKKDPRLEKLAKTLPGPPTIPVIGNGLDFLYKMDGKMTIFKTYEKRYGSMFRLWLGKHLVVVLTNAEDLELVLTSTKTINKPDLFKPTNDFWGENSMFTATWHTWRKTRKELLPFFTKKILSPEAPRMNEIINEHVTQMKKLVDGPEFDLALYLPNLVYEMLMEMLFNIKVNPKDQDFVKLDLCNKSATEVTFSQIFKPWEQNTLVDYILYHKKKTYFKTETKKIFKKYLGRESFESSQNMLSSQSDEKSESNKHASILPTLFQLGDELGEQYVEEEARLMIAAGVHTSAITMSFFLLTVAMQPETQEKLYQEITETFGNDNRELTLNDVDNLPYLDQVLKEVQRYYTLVLTIFRKVDSDVNIGGSKLPAGTAILIPITNIHMNPKYYKNPDKFDPDHFTPEAVSNRPKYAFLPFSAGPRNCLGKVLAELEMKLTFVALLRNFKFTTSMKPEDIILVTASVAVSLNGYNVKIHSRK